MSAAPQEALRRADGEARERARSVFDRPLILEAGAGTGKTTTLVARVLTWCLAPGWERARAALPEAGAETVAARVLERITAITFTEKAAAEMSAGIAEGLGSVLRGERVIALPAEEVLPDAGERRERALALLTQIHRLQVGTIHAFCRRVLAAWPLEAGLHPDFQVDADGLLLREVVEEVMADLVEEGYGVPGNEHLLALAARGVGPDRLAAMLESLASQGHGPEIFDEDVFGAERVETARRRLREPAEWLLNLLRPVFIDGAPTRSRKTDEAAAQLDGLVRTLAAGPGLEALLEAVTAERTDTLAGKLKDWAGGVLNRTEAGALGDGDETFAEAARSLRRRILHLRRVEPEVFEHLAAVLPDLLRRVRERLRAGGIQTFSTLLRDADRLLETHEAVTTALRRSMDQLLVDEFQDTDPLQYRLVRRLALEGPPEERPGLFLVGDPKQSIYGWRQADLGAYEAFKGTVRRSGGSIDTLCVNFRSHPHILEEVERVIAPSMVPEEGLQPPFERLLPSPANLQAPPFRWEGRRPVECWVSWAGPEDEKHGPGTTADRAREIEARAVARDLRELHAAGLIAWSDAAILLRQSTAQETYLEALRAEGIPYAVERDAGYYRRREVIDATAALRTVIDPNDHLALLAFLRAPFVGVPDAALIPLWKEELPERIARLGRRDASGSLPEELVAAIDRAAGECAGLSLPGLERVGAWPASLKHALAALAALRRSFAEDPAEVFVQRLRGLLLMEETAAARFLGAHRLANLERFFRQVFSALTTGAGGPHGLLRELRRATAEGLEAEEGAPGDEALDAVRVMTVHKAKGLTFKQVYLVDLHHQGGGRPEGERVAVATSEDGLELLLPGTATLLFDQADERAERIGNAEMVRILYVAMTRPRDRLVLCGSWKEGDWSDASGPARRMLTLLGRRRGGVPPLQERFQEALENGNAAFEHDGHGLWRFPAADTRPVDPQPPGAEDGTQTISFAEARRQAEVLARRRAQALLHQDRPFILTPSAAAHQVDDPSLKSPPPSVPSPGEDALDPAIGTAIHRALEVIDLEADPEEAIQALQGRLPLWLRGQVPPDLLDEAVRGASAFLDRVARGSLLRRLRELAPHVLAREEPFIMSPDLLTHMDPADRPLGAVIGTLDLLYRDPADGRLVVADYKTDRVEGTAIQQRATHYAPQGRLYVTAMHATHPTEPPPRFELWFLHPDRILTP